MSSGAMTPRSRRRLVTLTVAAGLVGLVAEAPAQGACSSEPLAVQVLGSGGPHAGGPRASAGYLVWRAGRAVVMVDAGGGTFLRFGEAGARLQDLSLLAISHLHPDHVSDLPALLWLSDQARQQPLAIAGPSGGGAFPPFDGFLARLFERESGAFPVLAGTLGQPGRGVRLAPVVVDAGAATATQVWADTGLVITAIGVPHGDVPSIAYRIQVGGRRIVFGSDQNGSDPRFSEFAAGADLLVMHLGLSEQAPPPIAQVHARPSTVGQVARTAQARRLVLSHFIQQPSPAQTAEWFSLFDLEQAVGEVRKHFTGPVDTAVDLQCIPIR